MGGDKLDKEELHVYESLAGMQQLCRNNGWGFDYQQIDHNGGIVADHFNMEEHPEGVFVISRIHSPKAKALSDDMVAFEAKLTREVVNTIIGTEPS